MRAFWSDPYPWIHLAGLATVPIWLELCLLGLAVGDPLLPSGVEVLLVAAIGIAPILWMQWQRPFCIFSLTPLALKPSQFNEQQRRILRVFKSPENRMLAIATAVLLLFVLVWLYRTAPLVQTVAPFSPDARWAGLLLAAIAFLGCNLFVQVPVSVARALLTSDATLNALEPYPTEQIIKDFTLLGFRVDQILPPLVVEQPPQPQQHAKTTPPAPDQQAVSAFAPNASEAAATTALENSPWDEEDAESSPAVSPSIALDGLPDVAEAEGDAAARAESVAIESVAVDEDIWDETPSVAGLTVTESQVEQAEPQLQAGEAEEAGGLTASDVPISEVTESVATAEVPQVEEMQVQEIANTGIVEPSLEEIPDGTALAVEAEAVINAGEEPLQDETAINDPSSNPTHTTDPADQSVVETLMIEADPAEIEQSSELLADAAEADRFKEGLDDMRLEEGHAAAVGSVVNEDTPEAIAPAVALTNVDAALPAQPPLVEIEAADFDTYLADRDIAATDSHPTDEAEP